MSAVDQDAPGLSQQANEAEAEDDLQRPLALTEKTSDSPPFGLVSELLDLVEANRTKKMKPTEKGRYKQDLIARFMQNYRDKVGLDLLPVVRLLIPDRDRQRNTYGVKETFLANAFIDALGMNKQTAVAQKLLNWKQPTANEGTSGDFASVVKEVIQSRSMVTSSRGKLSIQQTNDLLDDLAKRRDKKDRANVIKKLYQNMTASELKWVIRIILKDLKISFRERTVLNALHPDAIELFNVCSDLKRVCWTLYDPSYRLPREDAVVKLFMPFKPMLSKRHETNFESIVKTMGNLGNDVKNDGFVMEEKLDGERIQIHKRGQEYRYFSRRDHEYTYLYGKTRNEGSLTPWLADCIHDNIDEIILDGEMLAWDPGIQKVLPFGTLKTAADSKNAKNNPWAPRPVFKVFDVLYAKGKKQKTGQNLLSKPYKNRREAVLKFTKEERGYLEWAEARHGKTPQDIVDYLDEVMNRFGEGLVIKNPKAPYILNDRGDSWIKVKPDYMLGEGETLELVVMGGFWGSGRRGGGFGSFMAGILDDEYKDGTRLLSFAKFGSGLSIDILADIKRRTEGKWHVTRGNPPPPGLVFGTEKPDEWLPFEDSFIVQVKAGDIVRDAAGYGAKYCLRFPRLVKYHREGEKGIEDVTCFTEYISKHRGSEKEKRKLDVDGWSGRTVKKPRTTKEKQPPQFADTFKGADVRSLSVSNDLFKGLKFWVIEGNDDDEAQSKNALERAAFEHGGDYQQSMPTQADRVVVSPRANFFVAQNAVRKGAVIVHPSWVVDCIKAGKRKPLSKKYVVERNADAGSPLPTDESDDGVQSKPDSDGRTERSSLARSDEQVHEKANETSDSESATASSATEEGDAGPADSEDEGLHALEHFKKTLQGDQSIPESPGGQPQPDDDTTAEVDERGQTEFDADPSALFKQFYFLLDTKEAIAPLKIEDGKAPKSADTPFWQELAEDISGSGGTIVSCDDPRLTHVVLDESDTTRASALQRVISKEPRRRNFVLSSWVYDSIGESHQKDEFEYRPY